MLIIGCDFHTRYQQIAMANDETGESAGGPGSSRFFLNHSSRSNEPTLACS